MEKKPFYKRPITYILGGVGCLGIIIISFVLFVGLLFAIPTDEPEQSEEKVEELVEEKEEEQEEEPEVDFDIDLEITKASIEEDKVIVSGTTNLIDGAVMDYQIRFTEGSVKVKEGKWQVSETISQLEKDDENNFFANNDVYDFYITFPGFGEEIEQDEKITEIYGGKGALNLTGGPNFYDADDGTMKYVSQNIEFDKDGIIDPDEKDAKAYDKAVEDWEGHYKDEMLNHYEEAGIIDIKENPGSDWDVVNIYVPNEFKLSSEDERRYYVEEIEPNLQMDLGTHFGKSDLWIEFYYEDGNPMATRKAFGGWKIR